MIIEKLPLSGIADFAIPYDPAIYEEPEPTDQLDFFRIWSDAVNGDENDEY
jgi:hypothetical protein